MATPDSRPESRPDIKGKFLSDHRALRGKAAVVTALALNVLRGDRDLASALRLKGEELSAHLLRHMWWEESQLLPFLAASPIETFDAAALIKEHGDQRQRLAVSLVELQRVDASLVELAQECLALVRWLEIDMACEEHDVLKSIAAME